MAFVAIAFTQNSFAQEVPKTSLLLSQYYQVKDALVAGNSALAASGAEAFAKTATSIEAKVNSEITISALVKDAGNISSTQDIKKQREFFAGFSVNMSALAKAVKLTDQPVYQAYCPMKKAYWLSSDKAIKNPYYGSSMLTCGKVTETIQ